MTAAEEQPLTIDPLNSSMQKAFYNWFLFYKTVFG